MNRDHKMMKGIIRLLDRKGQEIYCLWTSNMKKKNENN